MSVETERAEENSKLIFDGQCPFCQAYVATLDDQKQNTQAGLNKVDARCTPELVEQLADKNIDINTGIVLIKGDAFFQGAEALTILARGAATKGGLNGLLHHLLRYRRLSILLYPVLRALRNLYLRLSGRTAIKLTTKKNRAVIRK